MTTEITTPTELKKMDPVFGQLSFDNNPTNRFLSRQRYRFKGNNWYT